MGVGAAGVVAPALAIIAGLYPPEERAGAIAAWAVFGAVGLAIGPVDGRLAARPLLVGLGVPRERPLVAVGVFVGVQRRSPSPASRGTAPPDVVGAVLSVLGLAGCSSG